MKHINLESNSSSTVNISHEILFVLRCLAYFWNSATLMELSKCILYQIHIEFFLIVEFSGPPNLTGQKDLLKTGESSNLAGRRIYRAMTVIKEKCWCGIHDRIAIWWSAITIKQISLSFINTLWNPTKIACLREMCFQDWLNTPIKLVAKAQ